MPPAARREVPGRPAARARAVPATGGGHGGRPPCGAAAPISPRTSRPAPSPCGRPDCARRARRRRVPPRASTGTASAPGPTRTPCPARARSTPGRRSPGGGPGRAGSRAGRRRRRSAAAGRPRHRRTACPHMRSGTARPPGSRAVSAARHSGGQAWCQVSARYSWPIQRDGRRPSSAVPPSGRAAQGVGRSSRSAITCFLSPERVRAPSASAPTSLDQAVRTPSRKRPNQVHRGRKAVRAAIFPTRFRPYRETGAGAAPGRRRSRGGRGYHPL